MKTEYLRTASNSYMIIKDAEYLFEPYELQMYYEIKWSIYCPCRL